MLTSNTKNQDYNKNHNNSSIMFYQSINSDDVEENLQLNLEEENNLIACNQASGSQGLSIIAVQPLLPSSPPNSPSGNTVVKEEIEDEKPEINDDVHNSEGCSTMVPYSANQLATQFVTDSSKEVIMCRNFVRGTCTKGHKCIFVHRVIHSQLPSVYQFCMSFQNTVCNFRKCKFVHATVTEKEYFLLTGYLPQHTLSHLREKNLPQPPPTAKGIHKQVQPIINHFFLPPPPPPPPRQMFRMGFKSTTGNLTAQQRTLNRRDDRGRARARLSPFYHRSLSQMF